MPSTEPEIGGEEVVDIIVIRFKDDNVLLWREWPRRSLATNSVKAT